MPDVAGRMPGKFPGTSIETAVLHAEGLTKDFPGVRALDNVDFAIAPGEVVALLGQNGAGKSTLIQIFAGAHAAGSYAGKITFSGREFRPADVAQAESAGIALVPQEVNIIPELSVAENITLNDPPMRFGMIDVAATLHVAKKALAEFDLAVDPEAPMASLDLATQQLVVIARALAKNARLLILDEPTAALTEAETQRLFDKIRTLRARGVAVIFVSHRLSEIFAISDRIVVMRDARIRGHHETTKVSRPQIVAEMIGGFAEEPAHRPLQDGGNVVLQVEQLQVFGPEGRKRVDGLDLSVRGGEVVGLFGLLGSGCIETAISIYGAYRGRIEGRILVNGIEARIATPEDAVRLGIGLMAQDRRDCLIGEHSISENIAIGSLARYVSHGMMDVGLARRSAQDQADALKIKAGSIDDPVMTLSGGNQQKVQIARWLAADAAILIMVDPTRGVDVGARRDIKAIWAELAVRGHAMLLASTDVEELVDVCDRVIVMVNGRAVGTLAGFDLTEGNLVRMASDA